MECLLTTWFVQPHGHTYCETCRMNLQRCNSGEFYEKLQINMFQLNGSDKTFYMKNTCEHISTYRPTQKKYYISRRRRRRGGGGRRRRRGSSSSSGKQKKVFITYTFHLKDARHVLLVYFSIKFCLESFTLHCYYTHTIRFLHIIATELQYGLLNYTPTEKISSHCVLQYYMLI